MDITPDDLAELLDVLEGVDFSYLQIERGGTRITITRGDLPAEPGQRSHALLTEPMRQPNSAPSPSSNAETAPPALLASPASGASGVPTSEVAEEDLGLTTIRAPMMGTFYAAPQPGAAPFVQAGDTVAPDTVVAIIEVMKLMTPVSAGVHGVIRKVCVNNDTLVDFDQVLFRVREV